MMIKKRYHKTGWKWRILQWKVLDIGGCGSGVGERNGEKTFSRVCVFLYSVFNWTHASYFFPKALIFSFHSLPYGPLMRTFLPLSFQDSLGGQQVLGLGVWGSLIQRWGVLADYFGCLSKITGSNRILRNKDTIFPHCVFIF